LIEAAIAHHQYFENDRLLEPLLKYVDLLYDTFGPGDKLHGYPGHPEIELALLRLHEVTGNPKHLALGRYFIDERGNPNGVDGKHFYDWEAERRGERPYERPTYFPVRRSYWYQQAHLPILEQDSVEGHSVRAMYLLTGAADSQRKKSSEAGCEDSKDYMTPLKTLWRNMIDKKMYMTGGIGAMDQWEGFGIDYFLPQSTDEGGCYAETCAAIGVMMLAQRMIQVATLFLLPLVPAKFSHSSTSMANTGILWSFASTTRCWEACLPMGRNSPMKTLWHPAIIIFARGKSGLHVPVVRRMSRGCLRQLEDTCGILRLKTRRPTSKSTCLDLRHLLSLSEMRKSS
jgi:hypothetical protein